MDGQFRKLFTSVGAVFGISLMLGLQPLSPVLAGPSAQPSHNLSSVPVVPTVCQTFSETGKTVCDRFLQYWQQHGALAQQGFPITNEFQETSDIDGKLYTVQYFERSVFELHPEKQAPYDVLLSLLGDIFYAEKYPGNTAPPPVPAPWTGNDKSPTLYFPETGKSLSGEFLRYWQQHGGLMQQGYPISETFIEPSELDRHTYIVQYFERAVFEWHPENAAPYNVLLSQLGKMQFVRRYGNSVGTPPTPTAGGTLSAGSWGGTGISLAVSAAGTHLEFGCAHGDINGPVQIVAGNKIDVMGTFTFEHGGPVRPDEKADTHPAHYTGSLTPDNTLTITVTLTDKPQNIGTFTVKLGQQAQLLKCL